MIGHLLGGLGLFLLGMGLLSDGLQTAAGDALRGFLRRYTRSRAGGLFFGAAVTALVQSSSATTLAVVGFVGAGLLPFEQAICVIFGANVGTTATAWIVATVGLKVNMASFALPIVGTGAVVKLFTRGKRSAIGSALAGFGLVFVGIDVLQTGMAQYASQIDPRALAVGGIGGRLALVGVGAIMTVVMQSSSAAVATTLTAIHSGAITMDHAAALVVGQNMGTTVTAVIAAVGGSAPARRVAAAHCVFNLGTGLIAVALLPWFVALVAHYVGARDASVALSGFHTAFNLLGVLVFVPLTGPLARELERRIPERGAALTARLSRAGVAVPGVAVEAAHSTVADLADVTTRLAARLLRGERDDRADDTLRDTIRDALRATREHLQSVRSDPAAPDIYRRHVSVLHATDHLQRLVEAVAEAANAARAAETTEVHALGSAVAESLGHGDASRRVAAQRRRERASILERTARGEMGPNEAEARLEALRWIDRVAYHAWRARHHLSMSDQTGSDSLPERDLAEESDVDAVV